MLKRRLALEVYDQLLSQLLSSELDAGARVTVDALARELGVSQTPIRDALTRLEADGLVVRSHYAGYRVAPRLTPDQFEQLVEIRLLLEPVAARRAAQNISPSDLRSLEALLASFRRSSETHDQYLAYGIFARHDATFHDAIAQAGGNVPIRDSLARLHAHVHLFRLLHDAKVTDDAIDEHARVFRAVADRDGEAAAYEMRRHVLRSAERFRVIFQDER